jgi:hypothetical protein
MKNLITGICLFLSIIFAESGYSQDKFGIGGSFLYNFTEKYPGAGARVLIPVKKKFWAVPYAYYYFPNSEFSGGLSVMYPFYKQGIFSFYAVASGTFRGSVSVSVNDSTSAHEESYQADGEVGFGVLIGPGCLKGLVEPRLAILNEEFIMRAGVVYFFGCKSHGRSGKSKGKSKKVKKTDPFSRKKSICPAYDY